MPGVAEPPPGKVPGVVGVPPMFGVVGVPPMVGVPGVPPVGVPVDGGVPPVGVPVDGGVIPPALLKSKYRIQGKMAQQEQ